MFQNQGKKKIYCILSNFLCKAMFFFYKPKYKQSNTWTTHELKTLTKMVLRHFYNTKKVLKRYILMVKGKEKTLYSEILSLCVNEGQTLS